MRGWFRNKTAFVHGADSPLGLALVRRFVDAGAMVVAAGECEGTLDLVTFESPSRIVPMPLPPGRNDRLRVLRTAWRDEPLHAYVDLEPLRLSETLFPGSLAATRRCASLVQALEAGLRAARGRIVVAVPEVSAPAWSRGGSEARAFVPLLQKLDTAVRPATATGLRLPEAPYAWGGPALASAVDALVTLGHPVSRGLGKGAVLDWAAPEVDVLKKTRARAGRLQSNVA